MYPALIGGAELHIIEEDIRLDLVRLNRYFEDNGITHAFMTTQVARQFATEIDNHSLKYLLTGGERLVPLEPPKNFELINGYGPNVRFTSQHSPLTNSITEFLSARRLTISSFM